ncbi:MAG: VanZ family protein [Candidatus Thiodiazotropha sp. (ex Myrtea sp. 'scaly one' KF741663)]|nr:VanZ family protein [Candidatus Thiodiazotropha sp. (ex Myrtea sp. 'scaly one' KF741663)]
MKRQAGIGWFNRQFSFYYWVTLGFCFINLLFFSFVQPFQPDGEALLYNRDFTQRLNNWNLEGAASSIAIESGVLTIDHGTSRRSTTLSQCRPAKVLPSQLMLSAEVMSRSVRRGDKSWHEARIDLVGYDSRGEGNYRVKTRLTSLEGDRDWRQFTGVFHTDVTAEQLCTEISLYSATGSFLVRQLSLQQAQKVPLHGIGSSLLLLGWILLGLWLAMAMFNHYRERIQGRYLLLILPIVMTGILMPHEVRLQIEQQVLSLFSHVGLQPEPTILLRSEGTWTLWPQLWDLSKISHLLGFMLLGGILFSERGVNPARIIFGLLLLAIVTELLQYFVPERTPRLSDLMVDSLGICLGWALGWVLRRFSQGQQGRLD